MCKKMLVPPFAILHLPSCELSKDGLKIRPLEDNENPPSFSRITFEISDRDLEDVACGD